MRLPALILAALVLALAGCSGLDRVGKAPDFVAADTGREHSAMYAVPFPATTAARAPGAAASLWSGDQTAMPGDRRAVRRGDILTVVIEIDESAEISNASGRSRTGSQNMGVPQFLGLPQRIDDRLPDGAGMANAVGTNSSSTFRGEGSVRRNEKIALRIATTVVETLPNGVMRIEGTQEVRVNNELRALTVSGFVRPIDISRRNEVTYDRIAGARISYGGRGQISDMQQPRWGQQVTDAVLPF